MSKNVDLNSINKEWKQSTYSDGLKKSLPPVEKYYPTLSKSEEDYISKETIEYIYLPKQKVYVAQTWDGNFAIGKNTSLFKKIFKNEKRWDKKSKQKDKARLKQRKKTEKTARKNTIKERKLYEKEVRGIRRDRKKINRKKGKIIMKQKTKQTLKTILLSVLGVGAIVGVASGINTLVEKNDTELKTIHPTFVIGGLNEADGKYEKSDTTLYTKDAFECQGLEIKLDFDNYIKYQVFFYEEDGDFIEASSVYDGNVDIVVPNEATHARIELTPNWAEMGEDYEDEENQIVKWYEAPKYASQIEVKVNKEQLSLIELYTQNKVDYEIIGKGTYDYSSGFSSQSNSPWNYTSAIDTRGYSTLIIKIKTANLLDNTTFAENLHPATSIYDLTKETSCQFKQSNFDNESLNVIGTEKEYTFVAYDVSATDSVCISTIDSLVDTMKVYLY